MYVYLQYTYLYVFYKVLARPFMPVPSREIAAPKVTHTYAWMLLIGRMTIISFDHLVSNFAIRSRVASAPTCDAYACVRGITLLSCAKEAWHRLRYRGSCWRASLRCLHTVAFCRTQKTYTVD